MAKLDDETERQRQARAAFVDYFPTLTRWVAKRQCAATLAVNAERVQHFKRRLAALGFTETELVIVIINVDDVHGGPLADVLMPNYQWQGYRDRLEIPVARGLAGRPAIQHFLTLFDDEAARKLETATGVVVVVVDFGVAEVYTA